MTRRVHVDVPAPALGGSGTVIVHGHYGRPFLVFPSERGRAWDFENNGMLDAVRPLLDDGRIKVFCVTSHDAVSWSNRSLSIEDRARRHAEYEEWIIDWWCRSSGTTAAAGTRSARSARRWAPSTR